MEFTKQSIKQIKAWLESVNYLPSQMDYKRLLQDGRSAVKPLIDRIHRKRMLVEQQKQLWHEMTIYERKMYAQGYEYIAGVDEVGRGPLAGPVVSAAVILPKDFYLPGLNDSKQLNLATREAFYEIICEQAIAIGIAVISVEMIDQINILQATHQAMQSAIAQLQPAADFLFIDAEKVQSDIPQLSIIGGDSKSVSIAAASVVAKVTRDRMMCDLAKRYPHYGFDRNMGYGTKEHLEAIAQHGVTDVHRRTFAGVKEWVK